MARCRSDAHASRAARCGRGRPASLPKRAARETRSEEHTSELQSQSNLVCRLLLEKKKKITSKCATSTPSTRAALWRRISPTVQFSTTSSFKQRIRYKTSDYSPREIHRIISLHRCT